LISLGSPICVSNREPREVEKRGVRSTLKDVGLGIWRVSCAGGGGGGGGSSGHHPRKETSNTCEKRGKRTEEKGKKKVFRLR